MPTQSTRHSLDKPNGNENFTRALYNALIDEIDAAIPITSEIQATARTAGNVDTDDATTPTALTSGITYDQVLAAEGWPADGTLLTIKVDNDNVLQILSETDGDIQTRHAASTTTWSAWKTGAIDLSAYARKDTAQQFTEDQQIEAGNIVKLGTSGALQAKATDGEIVLTYNARWNGSNWVRLYAEADASMVELTTAGDLVWYSKSDGNSAAGSTITWAEQARITYAGRVLATAFADTYVDKGNVSGALAINCLAGAWQRVAMTGNITSVSFSDPPASGKAFAITLELEHSGAARTVTWPGSVKWPGGTTPTLSSAASDIDIITLVTRDGGTTWYGFVGGLNF